MSWRNERFVENGYVRLCPHCHTDYGARQVPGLGNLCNFSHCNRFVESSDWVLVGSLQDPRFWLQPGALALVQTTFPDVFDLQFEPGGPRCRRDDTVKFFGITPLSEPEEDGQRNRRLPLIAHPTGEICLEVPALRA